MADPLVLSIFPGIDLLGMAFEQEGFCLVRGPDLLWGGEIKTFHPPAGVFDGVIGGPPCQAFSVLANYGNGSKENLIPEFERCIEEAKPDWFVMENVRQAPDPTHISGYFLTWTDLNNRWLGQDQNRIRRFWFGSKKPITPWRLIETEALESARYEYCVTASDHTGGNWPGSKRGKGRTVQEMARLQGLPDNFKLPALTRLAFGKGVGNAVPLPMGRAIAKAVKRAMYPERVTAE